MPNDPAPSLPFSPPTLPIVHLNGTSPEQLAEANAAVVDALRKLENALHDAAPNARDYYPAGADAYPAARGEHVDTLRVVRALRERYERIAEHLQDRIDEREHHRKR